MTRIAIAVSGGDAPGINATIEAIVLTLTAAGAEAWGVRGGLPGLVNGEMEHLSVAQVFGTGGRGGALLGTSRQPVLAEPDAQDRLRHVWQERQLAGLILLGGDGSIRKAGAVLHRWSIPLVAIPTTIDNDVPETDRTLGFDSACNHALPTIDALRDTATALPGRLFVVETLGGSTGHIALAVAHAVQADAVCVPEAPYSVPHVARQMARGIERHQYGLCVVSEGIGDVPKFCAALAEAAGQRVRLTTLGHAQRGGVPSHFDRWLGRVWGEQAAGALLAGRHTVMLAWRADKTLEVPLETVIAAPPKTLDQTTYALINPA